MTEILHTFSVEGRRAPGGAAAKRLALVEGVEVERGAVENIRGHLHVPIVLTFSVVHGFYTLHAGGAYGPGQEDEADAAQDRAARDAPRVQALAELDHLR